MKHKLFIRSFLVLLALSFVSVPVSVLGQVSPQVMEAAKKEGEAMLYGAIPIQLSKPIGDLFEKKYGIKLKHWRGDATELINRSLAEARAGKNYFDVILGNEGVMMSLDEKGLLAAFTPPAAKGFPKQFRQAEERMVPGASCPTA